MAHHATLSLVVREIHPRARLRLEARHLLHTPDEQCMREVPQSALQALGLARAGAGQAVGKASRALIDIDILPGGGRAVGLVAGEGQLLEEHIVPVVAGKTLILQGSLAIIAGLVTRSAYPIKAIFIGLLWATPLLEAVGFRVVVQPVLCAGEAVR